jgi:hypothetical protein
MPGELLLEAYPLTWPDRPRTPASHRRNASFKLGLARSRDELIRELDLLEAKDVVVSSNVPVRRDGLPLAGAREPEDPGVAVYFDRLIPVRAANGLVLSHTRRPFVIACDTYRRVQYNLRAIGVTVEALRAIQRHGATEMLEQAFTGFAALPPAPAPERPWWLVLGVDVAADVDVVRHAYRELALRHHPDHGGDASRMAEINRAFQASGGRA